MNSTDSKLTEDETVLYCTKYHWAVLLGPSLVIIIGSLALKSQGYHAMALITFGLAWCIFSYTGLRRSEIALTRHKVFINPGFPFRRHYDIPLDQIMAVDYYQPSLGSMLDFGKIIIIYKGKKKCAIRFVSSPAEFVKAVHRQIGALNPS